MKKFICIISAVLMMTAFSSCEKSSGGLFQKSCDKCDRIIKIQERINELSIDQSENADMEGSAEYEKNSNELYDLREQLNVLLQHDCPLPIENVKNKEYRYGDFTGKYTGEWKSNAPHGSGTYEGTDDGGHMTMYYSGDWNFGNIEGYGEYELSNSLSNCDISYKGDFVNNSYNGRGEFYQNIHMNRDDCITIINGEFKNGKLVSGDFQEADQNNNITDYGTMQGAGWTKTSSAKADAEAERQRQAQQQIEDQLYDAAGEFFKSLWR